MAPFFPRHTVEWKIEEPPLVRRITLSLPAMAVITGILVHLYRWFVLAHRGTHWWIVLLLIAGGLVLLLGLTTAHLGNHTVRQWLWRAPLFALAEGATEAAMSALMIAAGVERIGTERASWGDWVSLALNSFLRRGLLILAFALLLAAVVQWVRFALLRHEHRASTAMAIHEIREAESGRRE
jgi:hypothetical protein